MKTIVSATIVLTMFVNLATAQKVFKAQKKMVGTNIEKVEFTDFIKNTPKDKNFNNKFKVLEFWATYCKPCLAAVPHLNKLKTEFKDHSNLVFLSVTHETPEKAKTVFDKVNFETIVVSDTKKTIHKNLKIEYKYMLLLPRTVLIDNTNKIVWYGSPNELDNNKITKFLNGEKL